MNIYLKQDRGFTLIEVVLAIAVGLIIIAGVSVGYNYAKKAAITDNQNKETKNSVVINTQNVDQNSSTTSTSPASTASPTPVSVANGITFSFSPTSGSLPLTATVTCDSPGKKYSVAIFLDDQTKIKNALSIDSSTAGDVSGLHNAKIQLASSGYQSNHKVYCGIVKNSGASPYILSAPITVHYDQNLPPDPNTVSTSAVSARDAAMVRANFIKIYTAAYNNDIPTMQNYIVKADASIANSFARPKSAQELKDITARIQSDKIFKEGSNIILVDQNAGGVFIMEDGTWKFNWSASLKRI